MEYSTVLESLHVVLETDKHGAEYHKILCQLSNRHRKRILQLCCRTKAFISVITRTMQISKDLQFEDWKPF